MSLTIEGPTPFKIDPATGVEPKVGTLFLNHNTLVTTSPATHFFQRQHFLEVLTAKRVAQGLPPLSPDEENDEMAETVSLFFQDQTVLIRPVPDDMAVALDADLQLQSWEPAPKHHIRFLHARHPSVRDALRAQGELWRISQPPQTVQEMEAYIRGSQVAIGGRPIYRINRTTGTRWLTLQQFRDLAQWPDVEFIQHLVELSRLVHAHNRQSQPEWCFVPKTIEKPALLTTTDFTALSVAEARRLHQELVAALTEEVPKDLRNDDPKHAIWRNEMFELLTEELEGSLTADVVGELSETFYRQVLWLPGARFENGELIFDGLFDVAGSSESDPATRQLCDKCVRGFILNFLREFGELEYVNVGRIISAQSSRQAGRRAVYVAEIKPRNQSSRVLRIIRLQRWGIREHLDRGKDLLTAILEAHEYTHYVLDRRLGCQQLGMQIPLRMSCWDIPEQYRTTDDAILDIWVTYFERDYFAGTAATKISPHKLRQPEYALRFGHLLGRAAAANLVVGKTEEDTTQVIFDVGDEVVVENEDNMPAQVLICDHSRSFGNYRSPLMVLAGPYARPVNERLHLVPEPTQFAEAFLKGFHDRLTEIRAEYVSRKNAFRRLFQHQPLEEEGNFQCRWLKVLDRLAEADPAALTAAVRRGISACKQ